MDYTLHSELKHRESDLIEFVKQSKPGAARSLFDVLVLCWAPILFGLWLFLRVPSAWTYAIAFLTISSRMNACLVLAHDAWHSILMPSRKWNDFLGAWLCAYPFGSVFGNTRAGHLPHHRHLGTDADPDRPLHFEVDKDTRYRFIRHFLRHMFVGELITILKVQLKAMRKQSPTGEKNSAGWAKDPSAAQTRNYPEFVNLFFVQVTIGAALWVASGHWWMYFAIWFLPVVSLGALCNFLRAFSDHARLVADPSGPNEGRLITYTHQLPWERVFLAPFKFNFHAEHHLYPSVPHQYLRQLHMMIRDNEAYQRQCIIRRNYSGFLLAYWRQIGSAPAAMASKGAGDVVN